MTAAVVVTPASGSITHLTTACRVTCTGADNNTATGYSTANYPESPQVTYYFKWAKSGQDSLKSPVFSTNPGGTAEWNGVILPTAGTYTLTLNKAADDTVAATASVVVA